MMNENKIPTISIKQMVKEAIVPTIIFSVLLLGGITYIVWDTGMSGFMSLVIYVIGIVSCLKFMLFYVIFDFFIQTFKES